MRFKHLLINVLLKPLVIGILDLLEYAFFNRSVYEIHNFPDIVPDLTPGYWAAFVSGWRCSILLFTLVGVIQFLSNRVPKNNLKIVAFCATFCLFIMIFENTNDIFFYHSCFYSIFAMGEIFNFFQLRNAAYRYFYQNLKRLKNILVFLTHSSFCADDKCGGKLMSL